MKSGLKKQSSGCSKLHPVDVSEIEPFMADAGREKLVFCRKTEYFAIKRHGEIVGFTGILWYSNKAVFKNHYVRPGFRGEGCFKVMFSESIAKVMLRGIKLVEANCTEMTLDYYLRQGAKVKTRYSNCTKVHLSL